MSNDNGNTLSINSFITIDTILNSSRTDYDIYDSSMEHDNRELRRDDNSKETSDTSLPIVIYRFKFTEDFMEELYKFSKIHQYDERKDFKEAWKQWTEENHDIINNEIQRLYSLGYPQGGDAMDKMFKSARYYFRKKSTVKKTPRQRRQYISVTRELLNAMDEHIGNNIFNEDYQPKSGFVSFCKSNETILKESISKIFEQGIKDSDLIEDKIKKTYKNRYFMLTQLKNK